MLTENTQFVKYAANGGTTYEARQQVGFDQWTVFRVAVPNPGPGSIERLDTQVLHPDTIESSEDEWELEYMKVLHSAMEGEFIDDEIPLEAIPDRTGKCAICGKQDSVVQTNIDGDNPDGLYCYDCAGERGYCFGCGVHADGTQAYEFSEIGHYCENCQEQIRDTCDPQGDDLEGWEYPDYPTNAD